MKDEKTSGKIAIIRVRGTIRSAPVIRKTFELLRLKRQNYCVVYDRTPSIEGMAVAVKDYATYGTIDEATFNLLQEKLPEGKEKGFYRLCPPRGGFERKGTKRHFPAGALGDRKDKIVDLIRRMIP